MSRANKKRTADILAVLLIAVTVCLCIAAVVMASVEIPVDEDTGILKSGESSGYWNTFAVFAFGLKLLSMLSLCLYAAYIFKSRRGVCGLSLPSGVEGNWKTPTFISVLLFAQLLAVISIINTQSMASYSLLYQDSLDWHMDFFHSLCTGRADAGYNGGSIYPPICYMIFRAFAAFVPDSFFDNADQREAAFDIRDSQVGQAVLTAFIIAVVCAFVAAVCYSKKGKSVGAKILLSGVLLASAPFVFAFDRGNIIFFSLVTTMLFVFLYDSESAVAREIALISLAIATAIKLLPGVFFLLLLQDKRYKELARGVIYALVALFVPFLFFGGIEQIPTFFKNIFVGTASAPAAAGELEYFEKIGHGSTASFSGAINNIVTMFTGEPHMRAWFGVAGYILSGALIVLSFMCRGWRRIACLTIAMIGAFRFNSPYVVIYMTVPLIAYLDEKESRGTDGAYMFLFVSMFALFPNVVINKIMELNVWTHDMWRMQLLSVFVQNMALLIFAVALIVEAVTIFIIARVKKRTQQICTGSAQEA